MGGKGLSLELDLRVRAPRKVLASVDVCKVLFNVELSFFFKDKFGMNIMFTKISDIKCRICNLKKGIYKGFIFIRYPLYLWFFEVLKTPKHYVL